jgi:hypothetical protein
MRPYRLAGQYEVVIGKALVDREIATALLEDPVRTGLSLGLSDADAALLVGIQEKDLSSFAGALMQRLHGRTAAWQDGQQYLGGERLMRASGE